MQHRVMTLVNAAGEAASSGRWNDAERLWLQVLRLDPDHVQAIYSLGVHAFQRGDLHRARELLIAAKATAPSDPMIALTLSMVYQHMSEIDLEWEEIISSLIIEPYFLPGLLAKAEFLERRRKTTLAASVYKDALKIAPAEPQWPAMLRTRLEHAREIVNADTQKLLDYLTASMGSHRDLLESAQKGRWDEAISIVSGRTRPYHCDCNKLYIPRLPALQFYDTDMFEWIPELEKQTDSIRDELENLVALNMPGFRPYVAYDPGKPVNQWKELNHNPAWSSYMLWAHGNPVEENLKLCPDTAAALQCVDTARISGVCPNAMFSALAPHTHIPPHNGETNARLVAHLALIIPDNCLMRVGFETRQWQPGKVFVFDDSIEHEARNDSDYLRSVLIFDVWNPLLSKTERDMVDAMEASIQAYRQLGDTT